METNKVSISDYLNANKKGMHRILSDRVKENKPHEVKTFFDELFPVSRDSKKFINKSLDYDPREEVFKANCVKYGLSEDTFYKFNSAGFRSDEFKKDHDGKHVLFAGCSFTLGEGLQEEYIWPKLLYKELQKKIKTSGYFNIGRPGAEISTIFTDIVKYCTKYGNPEYVFVLLPDVTREKIAIRGRPYTEVFRGLEFKDEDQDLRDFYITLSVYNIYLMLNAYCKTNNIKLIMTTWAQDPKEKINVKNLINDLYKYNAHDLDEFVYSYQNDKSDTRMSEFILKSLDGEHPGRAYHGFWSQFLYLRFCDVYEKN